MARGKYSPTMYWYDYSKALFIYNAYGEIPPEFKLSEGESYDEGIHFANYDHEGYDSYGYSAFDSNDNYVGIGNGVDRNGYTELDYLQMSDEEWENL